MKILFLILFFSFNAWSTSAQLIAYAERSVRDSLYHLQKNASGIERIDLQNQLATFLSQEYPDSCRYYAMEAARSSERINYSKGKMYALYNMGNADYFELKMSSALSNYLSAVMLLEEEYDRQFAGDLWLQIANINVYTNNVDKALEYYFKAADAFRETRSLISEYFALFRVGRTYTKLHQFDSALIVYKGLIHAYRSLNDRKYESMIWGDMGLTYITMLKNTSANNPKHILREALSCYDSSITIKRDINYKFGLIINLVSLGEINQYHVDPPDYDKAEAYYDEALDMLNDSNYYSHFIAKCFLNKGNIYYEKGNSNMARKCYKQAEEELKIFFKDLDNTKSTFFPLRKVGEYNYGRELRFKIYEGFYNVYRSQGNYEKALKYYILMDQANDSLISIDSRRKLDNLLINAESDLSALRMEKLGLQNQVQHQELRLTQILLLSLVLLFILTILVIILIVRQSKLRTNQDKTILEQKLHRSQMNPHFIFNSLSSIQHFIVHDQPATASKYLAMFSKLVRKILESTVSETVSLEEEITSMEQYLELQKIRYNDMFSYAIEVDGKLDPEEIYLPAMLFQPYIENSIEHGIRLKNGNGKISIRIKEQERFLLIYIEDDGVGREKAALILKDQDKNHKSLSTSIIQERIKVLNRKRKEKISLEIIDLKNDSGVATGTKVILRIPVDFRQY